MKNPKTELEALKNISLSDFLSNLRTLSLSNLFLGNLEEFCEIFENFQILEDLNLYNVKIIADSSKTSQQINLLKLWYLKLHNCSWNFLQNFHAPNLKSIEVLYGDCENLNSFKNFLDSSTKLESVSFDGAAIENIFGPETYESFSFQLKTVRIISKYPSKSQSKTDENFHNFLKSQKLLDKIKFG